MTCSCPYDGDVCKHLVAVLLRFVEMDKTDIIAVPSLPAAVQQTLAAMSHIELLDLIVALADERDEFRRALMARLTIPPQFIVEQPRSHAQVRALQQQIDLFFEDLALFNEHDYDDENGDGYGDEYNEYDDEEEDTEDPYPELDSTFEIARTLQPLDQQQVFWHVLTCAESMEGSLVTKPIEIALAAYVDATRLLVHTPEERRAAWMTLLDLREWEIGGYPDVMNAVQQAIERFCETPDDTRQLIGLLRN